MNDIFQYSYYAMGNPLGLSRSKHYIILQYKLNDNLRQINLSVTYKQVQFELNS